MSDVTLIEFVLARIAEDEAKARAVGPTRAYVTADGPKVATLETADGVVLWRVESHQAMRTPALGALVDHVAAHQPGRVLADCEAKRRIVGQYQTIRKARDDGGGNVQEFLTFQTMLTALYPVVASLAQPYADHPDYDADWSPR